MSLTSFEQAIRGRVTPPSDDRRWKLVEATMRRNGNKPTALIETLHTTQDAFGHLDSAALRYVAASLGVPLSKVYGVATFYHMFTLDPPGKHSCIVCVGTACHILGAPALSATIEETAGSAIGQTTSDGGMTLQETRCFGSCGLAPAVILDGEVLGRTTPQQVRERLNVWMEESPS